MPAAWAPAWPIRFLFPLGDPMTTLQVNGRNHTLDVDPGTPVLWALRDTLGMTGTKFGCGAALCGACTVHLDGQPVRSCSTPLSAATGKKVITIEAIGSSKAGKAVQAAWVKHDVPQCGYCQSGMVMAATALLALDHLWRTGLGEDRLADLGARHLACEFAAVALGVAIAAQCCKVEPFVRLDQVHVDARRAARIDHAEFIGRIGAAARGIGQPAVDQELCALKTVAHDIAPLRFALFMTARVGHSW